MTDSTIDPTELLASARAAQARWRDLPVRERVRVFKWLRHALADQARARALAATVERKAIAQTVGSELVPLADACKFLEARAERILRPVRERRGQPMWMRGLDLTIHREPLGVVLVIAPSNYPLMLGGLQGLFGIAAGNAVLFKPSPGHEACAQAWVELLHDCGLSRGLWQVAPSDVPSTQRIIAERVDHIIITGSVRSGRAVLRAAADVLTPVTAELSGCDAMIVRADADLNLVLDMLAFGLGLNGGASCIAPRRVIVHESVVPTLRERIRERFQNADVAPRDAIGQRNVIAAATAALDNGAKLLAGALPFPLGRGVGGEDCDAQTSPVDQQPSPDPTLTPALSQGEREPEPERARFPLIVDDVPPASALLHADLFAPVCAIVPARDDDHAIALANDCPLRLGSSLFTRDRAAAAGVAARLDVGHVCINDLMTPTADPRAPFGGRGDSGFGVVRGADGLLAMTQPKVVLERRGGMMPHRQGIRDNDDGVMLNLLTSHHAPSAWRRLRALLRLIGLARRRS